MRTLRVILTMVPVLTLAGACGGQSQDPLEGSGLTGLTGLASGGETDTDPSGDDDGAETSETSASSGGNDPMFDVGTYDPDAPTPDPGCDKVDLLFVIDNSGSMGDNQVELVNSFPEFIDGIKTQLADVESYHVGVVTTDDYQYNAPGCTGPGQLVTQTGGEGASNAACGPYAAGAGYMTEADDLAQTFSCAAQVGTSGDGDEQPINSIRGLFDPFNVIAGGCNEGFLRQDSLLVIVVITDEDDLGGIPQPFQPPAGSAGSPSVWFDEFVAARGGVETNIAVLALTGNDDLPDQCMAGHASNLIEFTQHFTHGFLGDVCSTSYASFFEEAIGVVGTACNDFTPPG